MKNRLLLLAALLLAPLGNLFAQSFYEIRFTDKAGNDYKGLLVYISESESYMRMTYHNRGEYRVVNVSYQAKTGVTEDGVHYMLLLGSDPKYITDHNRDEQYNPDYFFWVSKDGQDYGLPYVTDDPNFSEENFKQVDACTELNPYDFTEDYLNQFYAKDEPDFAALLSMVNDQDNNYTQTNHSEPDNGNQNNTNYSSSGSNRPNPDGGNNGNSNTYNNQNNNYTNNNQYTSGNQGGRTQPDNGSGNTNQNNSYTNNNNHTNTNTHTNSNNHNITLHLIMAANTEINDIGNSCIIDRNRMVEEMEDVADALGIQLKTYMIEGRNFTKAYCTSTIQNLTAGSNDIILFAYTGHGFRWSSQKEQYPQLDFRYSAYTDISNSTSMLLSDINTMIVSKGARLNIVLGDCCNSEIGSNQVTADRYLTSRSDPNYNEQKLAKLFLKAKGNILSTAASPGQLSWSNPTDGGFFLYSFFQAFHEEIGYLSNEPTWEELMTNTIKYAEYKTSPDGCSNCSKQNGIKRISITYQ